MPRGGDALDQLSSDGVIAIEESYDVSANVFGSMDQRKKAPPVAALEPRTLELVRSHRHYLMQRNHQGLETGLLFPSEAGTLPVGNEQLNDVWRAAQGKARIDCHHAHAVGAAPQGRRGFFLRRFHRLQRLQRNGSES